MKSFAIILVSVLLILTLISCKRTSSSDETKIMFLHHSTGLNIWGADGSILQSVAFRINALYTFVGRRAELPTLFKEYNEEHNTNYGIYKRPFPSHRPYGWYNFPHNYYEIWVEHAGDEPYRKQPTLEILTKDYDVIMFKHCFPVSNIQEDEEVADINSYHKTIANFKLQYEAIKKKIHEFPDTKFILWTGAAQVKANITEDEALRAQEFFNWVREEWDEPDDNIYLWDFNFLETDGGLYLKDEYAVAPNNSHPNSEFSSRVSKLLFKRIIDVLESDGTGTTLTGEPIS
jgi:hypothetical protein